MALAAFTMPDMVEMIESAALLCPISYLDHITSSFVRRAVFMRLDQVTIGELGDFEKKNSGALNLSCFFVSV